MKIQFEQPIGFLLEVIETDDHVPSMRVNVQIAVTQFQHTCRYEGSFWIECANWDSFAEFLRNPTTEAVSLRDISEYFILALHKTDECFSLSWTFEKTDAGGGRKMKITFTSAVDDDVFAKIRGEFLEFPSWW